jgi:hypothetical protein
MTPAAIQNRVRIEELPQGPVALPYSRVDSILMKLNSDGLSWETLLHVKGMASTLSPEEHHELSQRLYPEFVGPQINRLTTEMNMRVASHGSLTPEQQAAYASRFNLLWQLIGIASTPSGVGTAA